MAKYRNRTVTLNKPFRTPNQSKKFAVYVKNPKTSNVIKVRFGDPKMSIKKISQHVRKVFWHVTNALLLQIEQLLDIGVVRNGSKKR